MALTPFLVSGQELAELPSVLEQGTGREAEWTQEGKNPNPEDGGSFAHESLRTAEPAMFYLK